MIKENPRGIANERGQKTFLHKRDWHGLARHSRIKRKLRRHIPLIDRLIRVQTITLGHADIARGDAIP